MLQNKRMRVTHKFCPHCKRKCNIKTYKDHRRLYFSPKRKLWLGTSSQQKESDSDSMQSSVDSFDSDSASSNGELGLLESGYQDRNDHSTDHSTASSSSHSEIADVEHWMDSDREIESDFTAEVIQPWSPADKGQYSSLVWWIVTFVSVFQTIHSISDHAIAWLLTFIKVLLGFCGKYSPIIHRAYEVFPNTIYLRDRFFTQNNCKDLLIKYVVCPSCHSINIYNDSYEKLGSQLFSKKCSELIYSKRCNSILLKTVISNSGTSKLYPFKSYCYNSLISSLQKLLLSPGFIESCESTRKCSNQSDILSDVYQGKVWKDFLQVDGVDFLSAPLCYGVLLNIDWFQPFDHFTYSVGIIYLAIINLPRSLRYKRQNIIIIGVIPGPSEPPLCINSYLSPLVSELAQLWRGVELKLCDESKQNVKAALLGVACDIPAGRKVCGFLSHSANLGCPRCYCEFSKGGLERDYSNFERSLWVLRDNKRHRKDIKHLLKNSKKSATATSKLESQIGCRYSVLLDLPYFDPVRMTLIDPMHNLYLGSAKYFVRKILLSTGVIDSSNLRIIHQRIKNCKIPVDMGRLPSSIDSGSTFTAEQWMNWTLYFSVFCMYGLLSSEQIECWRAFVLACRRLAKKHITEDDITVADLLLLQFCRRVKTVFGSKYITPNMHLHLHLATCIRDYGPLHAFWLFSFERFNGLLGNQPTNNRSIEMQLIKRFLRDNTHLGLLNSAASMPLAEDFSEIICNQARKFQSNSESRIIESEDTFEVPSKYTLTVLDNDQLLFLKEVYKYLHPESSAEFHESPIPSTCKRYDYILLSGKRLSSISESNQGKVPYALAVPAISGVFESRPIQILYFIQHSWAVALQHQSNPEQRYTHTFAVCEWPQEHPNRHVIGKPAEVWCTDLFETSTLNCFVPVNNIKSRVIVAIEPIHDENVLVVIPLIHN